MNENLNKIDCMLHEAIKKMVEQSKQIMGITPIMIIKTIEVQKHVLVHGRYKRKEWRSDVTSVT